MEGNTVLRDKGEEEVTTVVEDCGGEEASGGCD